MVRRVLASHRARVCVAAQDEERLLDAVRKYADIRDVHERTQFSWKFTFHDIVAKWHQMLFHPELSVGALVGCCVGACTAPPHRSHIPHGAYMLSPWV